MSYISLDARQSQAIITGTQNNGSFVNTHVSPDGHLEVDLKKPLFPFGSIHTEQATTLFQADGVYGVNARQHNTFVSGSGAISGASSLLTVSSGTTVNSRAEIESRKRLRYRPGQGVVARFTAKFTAGVADSFQGAGISNEENAVYVGYSGTQFGLTYIKNGVREVDTLTISTGSSTNQTMTVTLAGTAYTVAVTNSGSTVKTAYEISLGTYTGWKAEQVGSTVRFIADTCGDKAGTFSITAATAIGTFAETLKGVDQTTTFVASSDFNGDKLDGTDGYEFTIDPTKLNIYQLGVQYLGAGVIYLDVESVSSTGDVNWTRVHTFRNPNTLTTPNFSNPSFPFKLLVESRGSTSDLIVSSASYCGFVEGAVSMQGNRYGYFNSLTTVNQTNWQVLFSIKGAHFFGGKASQAVTNIISISAATEHNNPVTYLLVRNATLAGTPNFTAYDTNSATLYDSAATTATFTNNSQVIWSMQLGHTGQMLYEFSDRITIQPGETYSLVAKSASGAATYVQGTINTREDI